MALNPRERQRHFAYREQKQKSGLENYFDLLSNQIGS